MNPSISQNTQAILMLTAPLIVGRPSSSQELLTQREYIKLARFLYERQQQPSDFLDVGANELVKECGALFDSARIHRLLARGFLLSQAVERWRSRSIWVSSRADPEYPNRIKLRLKDDSPPIIYGCGEADILESGGLGVVGSRNADDTLLEYSHSIGQLAAESMYTLISGGARGIDQAAMRGAIDSGGKVSGVLAENLERAVLNRDNRNLLMDGRLVLISPYDPVAGFNVGHAMNRNKFIYALADAALVVNSDNGKGGTWAGASEQLDKLRFVPIYVRSVGNIPKGLEMLRRKGALSWPNPATTEEFAKILSSEVTEPQDVVTQPHLLLEVPDEAPLAEMQDATPSSLDLRPPIQSGDPSSTATPESFANLPGESIEVRKDQARIMVAKLVEQFQQLSSSQIKAFNEEDTKKDFILPLFKALGWDIEQKEEVAAEVSASNGRVDYAFKLNGVPRFFLEAKPLGNNLISQEQARQAVTYAYHKGITWALLCNFSHLKVFNANLSAGDPQAGLLLNLMASDYLSEFDRLWSLSKDGIEAGLLEEDARKVGRLRARLPVEQRLYAQLRAWREVLVNQTRQYHEKLTLGQVDEVIQKLFNRLIFIRTCEDRNLEDARLRAAVNQYQDRSLTGQQPLLEEIRRVFKHYESHYDSDLFSEHLLDKVHFDEPILAEILIGLHEIPGGLADYDFALIDADILGAVYEQYLGYVAQRVVRSREGQQRMTLGLAGEETYEFTEKQERRKSQGIYYTPKWVVDYVVRETVGRFIEEHKGDLDAIRNVKILDMACGSGSFLIRAYDELLNWTAQEAGVGVEQLTQQDRMPLLHNNIFGVDLDSQAVEIARLNLMLRALERRELLPSLSDNVRRGNSLISGTLEELKSNFGDDWELKRPFNWVTEFPQITGNDGFDIIIGNPPYVKEYQSRQPFDDLRGSRLAKYYQGKMDIWYAFACLAIDLLKPGGVHCFIATNNWMTNSGASILREKIQTDTEILEIVDFGDYKVFDNAGIQTMIYVVRKASEPKPSLVKYRRIIDADIELDTAQSFLHVGTTNGFAVGFEASVQSKVAGKPFTFVDQREEGLLAHIQSRGNYRLAPGDVSTGIDVHQDFVTNRHLEQLEDTGIKVGDGVFVLSHKEVQSLDLSANERGIVKPFFTTEELGRYFGSQENRYWVLYTNTGIVKNIDSYPNIKSHLDRFATIITSDQRPYGLHRARKEGFFLGEKIISLRKTDKPHFTYTDFPSFVSQTFFILKPNDINLKYLVGILNSKLSHFWLDRRGKKQGNALQVDKAPLLEIPIRLGQMTDPQEKEDQVRLVGLVDRMLHLQEEVKPLRGSGLSDEADLMREIDRTDALINSQVYDLYGLTDAERNLVESA